MPRFLRGLTARLILGVLVLGLLLGAALFGSVLYFITEDYKAQFVNNVREQSRLLATLVDQDVHPEKLDSLLADILLTGQVVDADYILETAKGERLAFSGRPRSGEIREDFFFGQHGDNTYYVVVPITNTGGTRRGTLSLGFDETYVNEQLAQVYRRGAYLAAVYTVVLVLTAGLLGVYIGRPLKQLRRVSHEVAEGRLDRDLSVPSGITEIADLAGDLERMRIELLRRSKEIAAVAERYRAILEHAAEAILTLNAEGRIESFNAAAERIFGYAENEVLGTPFSRFFPATEISRYAESDGEPRSSAGLSITVLRRNGESLPVLLSISAFRHDENMLYTAIMQDNSERVMFEEELTQLAHYDSLTDLPNRVLLQDRLNQAMREADRLERLVAVMFLDLDRFKTINDTLGHDTGDALLKAVAERLQASLRPGDTISRLGGDEFTVILANVAHVDDVTRVAQKILDQFVPPFRIGGRDLFVTPSIGITLYPLDEKQPENLLKDADVAMYHAKELGGNRFQFYTPELNARAARQLELETGLRQAIERREFILHYQPLVDVKTGRIIGMEALLRWQHPKFGLIPPLEFIPLAEDTGLIVPIGEWVLKTACAQIKAWHDTGFPALQVAVNLSSKQLRDKNLINVVKQALKEAGIEARYLDLELTESVLMHDMDLAITILKELKAVGVSFSLDDFGTGYSSLSYLKHFPIDYLKIDRSFIQDITTDLFGAGIVRAIIVMAHTLNIKVVAEGVETHEQLVFLRQEGCDLTQGYYCSKPLTVETFTELLQDWDRLRAGKCSIEN